MSQPEIVRELRALRCADAPATNGRGSAPPALAVTYDAKGKLTLPESPNANDPAGQCSWLTASFALDPEHPIIGGMHEGLRGAAGHVALTRLDAPPLRFEPASRINTPMRLIEDLTWQAIPTDDATPALKGDHCRVIAHVIRQLCGASKKMTDEQETMGIVGAYLGAASPIEGFTTYGTGPQRFEAVTALRRDLDESTGRPAGPARYLIDANTGEIAIRVGELTDVARRYIGNGLNRGWLDARLENAGWQRVRLDGHAQQGRDGRTGAHARCDVYRGHLPHEPDDDQAVTT